MSGPATRLAGALVRDAAAAGCIVTVAPVAAVPWASVTFTGERHTLSLTAAATPALDAWLARLAEAELAVAGWLVADCAVAAPLPTVPLPAAPGTRHVALEVLLLVT